MEKNYDNAAADIAFVRGELSKLVSDPELVAILGDVQVGFHYRKENGSAFLSYGHRRF